MQGKNPFKFKFPKFKSWSYLDQDNFFYLGIINSLYFKYHFETGLLTSSMVLPFFSFYALFTWLK